MCSCMTASHRKEKHFGRHDSMRYFADVIKSDPQLQSQSKLLQSMAVLQRL